MQVSFHSGSPRSSSPSLTEEQPLNESLAPTSRRPSNLTRANVKAVAAAAERKAQQAAAARKTSLTGATNPAAGKGKRPSVGGGSSKADVTSVDRMNLLWTSPDVIRSRDCWNRSVWFL